jgi:hypothetical protein
MGDFSFCCPCPVKVVPAPDFCGAKAPAEEVIYCGVSKPEKRI